MASIMSELFRRQTLSQLFKRQTVINEDGSISDGGDDDGWYSDKAEIAKYVVVGVILLLLVLWIVVGSWHARRRVRNGQAPLFYHRWLLSSRHRPTRYQSEPYLYSYDPRTGQATYQMHEWVYAPPAYGQDAPPQYQAPAHPPPGASKVNPDQTIGVTEVTREDGGSGSNAATDLQQPAPTQAAPPPRR